MLKDKNKKQTLIIIVSFFVSIFLMITFIVVPLAKKVYKQKDSLEEAKLMLERDRSNVDKYESDLKYLESNSFLTEGVTVNDDNRIKFIEDLEQIALGQNLELNFESYVPAFNKTKKNEAKQTLIKINLRGEYEDLMKFLYKLQNFKYEISLEEVKVEKFDESRIKILEEVSLENLPEIESEIIISFN